MLERVARGRGRFVSEKLQRNCLLKGVHIQASLEEVRCQINRIVANSQKRAEGYVTTSGRCQN